ncbi:hypothetical protein [Sulfurimonas sp.]|uniref:hypothetical protein n=1 Tax=Sulfurimonas sp. TaxID=2022749 RepID=UPI0025D5A94D|nr:hypothetical protein [Sulfurimonas sp.]
MSVRKNLQNKIFGDILVLEFDKQKNTHAQWKCLCMPCNKVHFFSASNLKSGNTKSCPSCGQKISNGLEQDIYWDLKKGEKITHISKKYNVARSVVYRVEDLVNKEKDRKTE